MVPWKQRHLWKVWKFMFIKRWQIKGPTIAAGLELWLSPGRETRSAKTSKVLGKLKRADLPSYTAMRDNILIHSRILISQKTPWSGLAMSEGEMLLQVTQKSALP